MDLFIQGLAAGIIVGVGIGWIMWWDGGADKAGH